MFGSEMLESALAFNFGLSTGVIIGLVIVHLWGDEIVEVYLFLTRGKDE